MGASCLTLSTGGTRSPEWHCMSILPSSSLPKPGEKDWLFMYDTTQLCALLLPTLYLCSLAAINTRLKPHQLSVHHLSWVLNCYEKRSRPQLHDAVCLKRISYYALLQENMFLGGLFKVWLTKRKEKLKTTCNHPSYQATACLGTNTDMQL